MNPNWKRSHNVSYRGEEKWRLDLIAMGAVVTTLDHVVTTLDHNTNTWFATVYTYRKFEQEFGDKESAMAWCEQEIHTLLKRTLEQLNQTQVQE